MNYGHVRAVRGITFDVHRGSTLGLLGGNGAGKTTTISTMLGLIIPSSGSVRVLGADMEKQRYDVLHRINLSSPYVALPALLTVRQILRFYGHLYNLDNVSRRVADLVDDLDLSSLLARPFGELSAGQKTRVSLAKALLNEPEVLFLDEPTASLDPDTATWVRDLLERYQSESGASVVIASHNMQEVERLCTDVVILGHGLVIESGTPEELLQRYDQEDLEGVFHDVARGEDTPELTLSGADDQASS